MAQLTEEQKQRGIITMSAGNHAQAVAFRAREAGLKATIIMPKQTPFAKVERTRSHGAEIILAGRSVNEGEATVKAYHPWIVTWVGHRWIQQKLETAVWM